MATSSQHRDTVPGWTENATSNSVIAHADMSPSLPSWERVSCELRWVWDLHVYGLATLFSVLAVLCLLIVLRLKAQLLERPHLSTANVFLGLLASSRLVGLFADPYGTRQTLPLDILQVLWDLGYPCLVSAFALLQLSFVRMTQVKSIYSLDESALTIIITAHFCLIITAGVMCAVQHSLKIVWFVTQIVFILWGSFLCSSSLFGCLRLLRSIVKISLQCLRKQVSPGYEINSIQFYNRPKQNPHPVPHQPRISITDVNEQTYSFASEASLNEQKESLKGSEALPLSNIIQPNTSIWPLEKKSKPTTPEDPALRRPLIAVHCFQEDESGKEAFSAMQSPQLVLSPMSRIHLEDFQFEAPHLKTPPTRCRLERQLRRLLWIASLGVLLCVLKVYDVFGPHGLIFAQKGISIAIVPWFCFQTISRIVEFIMAYSMVIESQQLLNSHFYCYNNN